MVIDVDALMQAQKDIWRPRIRKELDMLFNGNPFEHLMSPKPRKILDIDKLSNDEVDKIWSLHLETLSDS